MFKDGNDPIKENPTPERVFLLLSIIKACPGIDKDKLFHEICFPQVFPNENTDILDDVIKATTELGLIYLKDGVYFCTEKASAINSIEDFRKYSVETVLLNENTKFSIMTAFVLKNYRVFYEQKNSQEMTSAFRSLGGELGEHDLNGWRFWAVFWGLGYYDGSLKRFIPLCANRFRNALLSSTEFFEGGKMTFGKFWNMLCLRCPEIKGCITKNGTDFSPLITDSLIVLERIGCIEMDRSMDANLWYLQNSGSGKTPVSHITVKGN